MILVFDFDGTIHQTSIAYKKAIEESLAELSLDIKDFDYESFIGMSPKDVWDIIFRDDRDKDPYIKKNGDRIIKYMKREGKLYKGAYETLSYLKNKYRLFILSKCRQAYMREARKKFKLDNFFEEFFVGETYDFMDKNKILKKELGSLPFITIGDRKEDIEAGFKNGQKSIFASYGYGKIEEGRKASYIIEDIRDLKKIL